DKGRTSMTGFGQQIETIDELISKKNLPDIPVDAFVDDRLSAAEPIENFECPFGIADRARADRNSVVFVHDDDRDTALPEIDRRAQSYRAGADDDHRQPDARCVELSRSHIAEYRIGVRLHVTGRTNSRRILVSFVSPGPRALPKALCRVPQSRSAGRDT